VTCIFNRRGQGADTTPGKPVAKVSACFILTREGAKLKDSSRVMLRRGKLGRGVEAALISVVAAGYAHGECGGARVEHTPNT
jgi:hypothetical protein